MGLCKAFGDSIVRYRQAARFHLSQLEGGQFPILGQYFVLAQVAALDFIHSNEYHLLLKSGGSTDVHVSFSYTDTRQHRER